MESKSEYRDYLERLQQSPGGRPRLDEDRFDRLSEECDRLARGWDPDDVQLDEWKRMDELKFLLILGDEEDE